MTFEEFKTNVEQWSTDRGIYAHSSALAQALKAVSEVGELADATIKNDRDALKDAIGDVMVCLVNVAHMNGCHVYMPDEVNGSHSTPYAVAMIMDSMATAITFLSTGALYIESDIQDCADGIYTICELEKLPLLECCEAAWLEIKDRKGFLSPSGAFIKQE